MCGLAPDRGIEATWKGIPDRSKNPASFAQDLNVGADRPLGLARRREADLLRQSQPPHPAILQPLLLELLHAPPSLVQQTWKPTTEHRGRASGRPGNSLLTCGCGDDRTRTGDPLLAKQVLYQLSYIPGKV